MRGNPQPTDVVDWETFCSARLRYVHELAEVVEQGLLRQDTHHPVFCGCIDWHSSVHGCYALMAASRLTGQARWQQQVHALLDSDKLHEEIACLQRGELDHELPYGFAWLLKFSREYERKHDSEPLRSLSSMIADRLTNWLCNLSSDEIHSRLLDRKYDNISWPVFNLWEWSQGKQDGDLSGKLAWFVQKYLVPQDEGKRFTIDRHDDEFFSSSLQRVRTILRVLPTSRFPSWLEGCLDEEQSLRPLTHARFPHSGGLNFSRSWGFWEIYRATRRRDARDQYVRHIVTHMALPSCWRDDYKQYSHWVPQFGIYAIALSMDEADVCAQ